MEKQITIRAPKPILDKWLAALRSGEYKQAKGDLREIVEDSGGEIGYCCLGVLQMVTAGEIDRGDGGGYLPITWATKHGIEMFAYDGEISSRPWLPTLDTTASSANDHGTPFVELADAIEACSEGY